MTAPAMKDPINEAILLLTEEADSLSDCHTRKPGDWAGEPEAKAHYDHVLAIIASLSKLRAPVADERQPDGKRPDLDWIEGVRVTDTVGRGWCVRIDGTDIFEDVNRHGCKGRRSFQIASGLPSKQEAERAAVEWLDRQRAALASAPVAGEAQPVAWLHQCRKKPELTQVTMKKHERALAAKGYRPVPLYAAPQASEAVRDAGIAASEDVAPWTDFAGNPIKHGDRIRHPEGLEGVVVRLSGYADAHDAWCVAYQDRTVSRLSLQIGERGQAVVQAALSAQPGALKNGGSNAG